MTSIDDKTVAEIEEEIAEIDDPDALEGILAAEKDGKDRVTAIDAIEERLDEVTADEEADADAEAEDEDDESSPISHNPHGDFVRVRPIDGSGHIAGYSFDAGEVKEVKYEAKVKRALTRGELQLIR